MCGATLRREGDLDKAIADYTEAIRLRPEGSCQATCRGPASTTARGRNFDKAIADWTEAIRLDPKCPRDSTTVVCALLAKGRVRQGDC